MITLLIVGGLLFLLVLTGVVLFVTGIKRQNKKLMIAMFFVFATAMVLGFLLVGLIAFKGAQHLRSMFKPRTGAEIYQALLGKPNRCVSVINHQDQVIPIIDIAIWLEADICEEEFQRIVPQSKPGSMADYPIHKGPEWFLRGVPSDSIEVYTDLNEFGNGRIYYVDKAHTHLFLEDIAD